MKYFYDRTSDSLYLSLAERRKYHESVEAAPGVVLDLDETGHLIGLDLERASGLIDTSDLHLHEQPSLTGVEAARLDGEELRRKREQLGMSQVELGRKLSVSPNTVARWERGELKIEHPGMLQLALATLKASASTPSAADPPQRSGKTTRTVPQPDGWANVRRETERGSSVHAAQTGKFRERDRYGDDPGSRRSKKK